MVVLRLLRPVGWLPFVLSTFWAGLNPMAVLLAVLIAIWINGINLIADAEWDRRNPNPFKDGAVKRNPIGAEVSRDAAWTLYLIVLAAALWVSLFTSLVACAVTLVLAALGYAYSFPPLHLKGRAPLDILTNAFGVALTAFYAGIPPWWMYGLLVLYHAGMATFWQAQDVEVDRLRGLRTTPVVMGKEAAEALGEGLLFILMLLSLPTEMASYVALSITSFTSAVVRDMKLGGLSMFAFMALRALGV